MTSAGAWRAPVQRDPRANRGHLGPEQNLASPKWPRFPGELGFRGGRAAPTGSTAG